MQTLETYKKAIEAELKKRVIVQEPEGLYAPITYILSLGGKRLRPVLTLMTADIFGGDYQKAIDAALAIEVFHNFSLVHDDIMDEAPLRRGKATVHKKWDMNTGILSGDAMLINAYQFLENYSGNVLAKLFRLFSKTAIEVCEGQQYDVDFEQRNDVTIPEYLKMIAYKTAVLVAAAMKMGAIIAEASEKDQDKIYDFGQLLGVAFQLQDDYLDAFGDPKTFGKQVGGDIMENKKTYLYLKALELGNAEHRGKLEALFSKNLKDNTEKVKTVKQLFLETGSAEASKAAIAAYTEKAFAVLETLDITTGGKAAFKQFGEQLMQRTY